jgi:OH-DDVA meta-cleavage compound hydrolase
MSGGMAAPMVIDVHGHITAPDSLYAWKAGLLSHRGSHGRGDPRLSDDEMRSVVEAPTFGEDRSHLQMLDDSQIDLQLLSPRPYQSMHSESPPMLVQWWTAAVNDAIAQQARLYPSRFAGLCGLPSAWGTTPADWIGEFRRCVTEHAMLGCLLNPDPSEGLATKEIPDLGDRWWYPLFETACELDVPIYVHGGGCKTLRHTYSVNFILEETIAIMGLARSSVLRDFPALKIIVAHGGGAVPYQLARFSTASIRRGPEPLLETLRRMWFDTVLYSHDSLEFLLKVIGPDRCCFGTERPGVGTVRDPETGRWLDDLVPIVEAIDWLTPEQRSAVFETNARDLFRIGG